jgi:hypothetical protein
MLRIAPVTLLALGLAVAPAAAEFQVTFGNSWDGIPLQQILDDEYGVGALDAQTDSDGYLSGDADPPYWVDAGLNGVLIREIAGYASQNTLGWYREDLAGPPIIDDFDDGVVFDGALAAGASESIVFPGGVTRFGFYLNPNGSGPSNNAPEPELFFTNRFYNDLGADGSGPPPHAPSDGDPQCLIYNVTHLNQGVPTYVLAWEDLDYGGVLTDTVSGGTDNDFNDLVIEISADSPVPAVASSWGKVKALYDKGR